MRLLDDVSLIGSEILTTPTISMFELRLSDFAVVNDGPLIRAVPHDDISNKMILTWQSFVHVGLPLKNHTAATVHLL